MIDPLDFARSLPDTDRTGDGAVALADRARDAVLRACIVEALDDCDGDTRRAAETCQMTREALVRAAVRYGIPVTPRKAGRPRKR